jgi:hypothetical protein
MTFATELPDHPLSSRTGPEAGSDQLRVVAWDDPLIDAGGWDPRSAYVERFWLPVLGPSATWLLRMMADGLESSPDGFDLSLDDAARRLGLGGLGSRHSPFQRAILRCTRYGVARHLGPQALAVRRRIASVPRRHLVRLPGSLRDEHELWEAPACDSPDLPAVRRRARSLALELTSCGEAASIVERRLARWGVHPALAYEAAAWAGALHEQAVQTATAALHRERSSRQERRVTPPAGEDAG